MSCLRQHVKWLVMGAGYPDLQVRVLIFYSSCHEEWVQNVLTISLLYKSVGFVGVHITTSSQDALSSTLSRLPSGAKEKLSFYTTLHYSALNVCC